MGGSQTSTTTNTYDKESSQRMAAVAERQQAIADDQWSEFKSKYEPFYEQLISANSQLVDPEMKYTQQQLADQTTLEPLRAQATQMGLQETMRDIQQDQPIKDAQRANELTALQASQPTIQKFYDQVNRGPEYEKAISQAEGDVAQSMDASSAARQRELSSMGISPTSGRALSTSRNDSLARATALGLARSTARQQADDANFQRLSAGMQAGRSSLSGVTSTSTSALGASQQGANTFNPASYQPTDASARALSAYSSAGSEYGALASRPLSSTTTTSGGGGIGGFFGGMFGTAAGALSSGFGQSAGNSLFNKLPSF